MSDEQTDPAIPNPPPEKPVRLIIYDATTGEPLDYPERTSLNCMCSCKCGGARLMSVTPAEVTIRHGDRWIKVTAVGAPGAPKPPSRRSKEGA